ncbi:MAG: MATE family efflux transporter [Acidobacteria bacterium]|nr:MAG: MATE family efflux transporter [Acidobacteriota bacterium]
MSQNGTQATPQVQTGTAGLWAEVRGSIAGVPRDYTRGPIGRAILLLSIPMVLEMSMQSLFGVVDVFFVGRLGADAVAVVGLTDSLLMLIFAVGIGLGMGTTAMVARRIGEGSPERASQTAVQALGVGVAISLPIGLLGVLFAGDLLRLVGASEALTAGGARFTAIILGGNVTVMLLFLINAVFRGAGEPALAMRALWIANIINMLLDPVLIFGLGPIPALGLEGAAIATTVGRGLGVVYQLWRLAGGRGRIVVGRAQLVLVPAVMLRLLRVSGIGILQFLISTASFLGMVRIVALFGETAVAGYTIAVRVIVFVLLPAWGVGNAAATLVGQNLGAGDASRAERAVWITGFSNMVFLGAVAVGFVLFPGLLVSPFSSDPEVLRVAADCLRIVSFSYIFWAFGMVTVMAFNGAGDTATPTWINLFVFWVLQIPLAYWLSVSLDLGPRGVFIAIAVSQTALAVVGVSVFRLGRWKTRII